MVHRNKGVPDWMLDDKGASHEKGGKAMPSFAKSVLQQANQMKKAGKSDEEIASSFNVSKEKLKQVLREATAEKPKCDCDDETPQQKQSRLAEKANAELSEAEKAYNSLRTTSLSRKRSSASAEDVDAPTRRNNSIASAKAGRADLTDNGGPKRQLKYQNSMWDSEILQRTSKEMDNGERIRRERETIEKKHQAMKAESYEHLIDGKSVKDAAKEETRTNSSIKSLDTQGVFNYSKNVPQNGISIFDKGFDRLAEKTEGERVSEERRATKPKDRSWVEDGSNRVSSKGLLGRMIDSMLDDTTKDKKE